MKRVFTFLFMIVCCSSVSFSVNYKVDWISYDINDTAYDFWLKDNDSTAVSFITVQNNQKYSYSLQIWDLAGKKLIKSITLQKIISLGEFKLNSVRNEFFEFNNDTLRTLKFDDLSVSKLIYIPTKNYLKSFYDETSDCYCLLSGSKDTLFTKLIKIGEEITIKADTIMIPDNKQISVSVADNGAYFVVYNGNKKLFVYSTKDSKLINSKETDLPANTFSISNSGKYLGVNTNYTDTIPFRIYNLENPDESFYINNQILDMATIRFNRDENKIILASVYSGQYVYEMNNPVPVKIFNCTSSSNKMKFCLDDNYLIDISNRRLLALDKTDGEEHFELSIFDKNGKNYNIETVRFEDSNEFVFVGGGEGILSGRDNITGEILGEFALSKSPVKIMNSEFSSIKDTIIYSSGVVSNRNLVYYTKNGITDNYSFEGIRFSPLSLSGNNQWLAGHTYKRGTFLYNLTTEQKSKIFYLDSGREWNSGAAFSSDSRYLAAGGTGNILKLYDLNQIYQDTTPVKIFTYPNPVNNGIGIRYVKFIDKDKKIVTSSSNYFGFAVWSAETGELLAQPKCPETYANKGEFFTISYMAYREKFDDYITADIYGQIFIWDKNFNFKSYFSLMDIFEVTPAIAFDYNNTLNKLVIGGANSTIAMISFDDDTDIEPQISDADLTVSPNPATDFITINLQPSEGLNPSEGSVVEIYDMLGVKVISEQIHPMTSSHRMNIEHLPSGVYFIKIGGKVEKFVKIMR